MNETKKTCINCENLRIIDLTCIPPRAAWEEPNDQSNKTCRIDDSNLFMATDCELYRSRVVEDELHNIIQRLSIIQYDIGMYPLEKIHEIHSLLNDVKDVVDSIAAKLPLPSSE